jgi:hypothetical protein
VNKLPRAAVPRFGAGPKIEVQRRDKGRLTGVSLFSRHAAKKICPVLRNTAATVALCAPIGFSPPMF